MLDYHPDNVSCQYSSPPRFSRRLVLAFYYSKKASELAKKAAFAEEKPLKAFIFLIKKKKPIKFDGFSHCPYSSLACDAGFGSVHGNNHDIFSGLAKGNASIDHSLFHLHVHMYVVPVCMQQAVNRSIHFTALDFFLCIEHDQVNLFVSIHVNDLYPV